MGCTQSKTDIDVIEPISAAPFECGKTSLDLAFTEIILDGTEETSSSVPPASMEEVREENEADATIQEEPTEQPDAQSVAVEEPDERVAADVTFKLEVSVTTVDPVVVQVPVEAEDTVALEADEAIDTVTLEADEAESVAVPAVEVKEEALVEPEVEDEEEAQFPAVSVVKKSAATSGEAPVWTFVAINVSFTIGVAFFNLAGSNSEGGEVQLTKRYSEFKALHTDMAKLMSREELPCMPSTSFLQSRNDKALLQERESVFVEMLNAFAQHPDTSKSASFAAFLA